MIKIEPTNKFVSLDSNDTIQNDTIQLDSDSVWEYSTVTPLTGLAAKYIKIPMSLILDDEIDARRVAIFSYLRCRCGIDGIVGFSVPSIVTWCGNKLRKGIDGTNNKFLDVIDALNDRGYLTYLTEPSKSSYMECEFDLEKYNDETKRFALVYLDEIHKILKYKNKNSKDTRLTNTTILLVFAYLRGWIYRRPNEMKYEERNIDGNNNHTYDVNTRRHKHPEAYNDTFKNISIELGISEPTLVKAVNILEEDLGLIVTDTLYRLKNAKGEHRTPHTIFANAYKRERENLLAAGESYSRAETEAKLEKMKKDLNNADFKINKEKRKTGKGAN